MPVSVRGRVARGHAIRGNLKLNKFQRAQRELNAQSSSYSPISLGRTAPSRVTLAEKINQNKLKKMSKKTLIRGVSFSDPELVANKSMQKARSDTARELLQARKKLRELGWVKKPRTKP